MCCDVLGQTVTSRDKSVAWGSLEWAKGVTRRNVRKMARGGKQTMAKQCWCASLGCGRVVWLRNEELKRTAISISSGGYRDVSWFLFLS